MTSFGHLNKLLRFLINIPTIGGGLQIFFHVHPSNLGKNSHVDEHIFQNRLNSTTNWAPRMDRSETVRAGLGDGAANAFLYQ